MAFPGTVDTVTVTLGPVLTAGGNPLTGAVFKAELPVQVRVTDSGFVLPTTAVAKTGTDGIATLVLVATDSTGIDVTGFTYTITAPSWSSTSQAVALPAASPSVRVEDLVSVTASDGSTIWLPATLADTTVAGLVTDTGSATYTAVAALAGGGSKHTVQEEGSSLTARTYLNFIGSTVTAADDAGSDATTVTVSAAAPSHTHTVSDVTDAGGAASLNVGTTTGTVAAGDDSRFTDARTPTAHASTHATGQSDAIAAADIGAAAASHAHAASDVTSGTVATARLGSGTADSTTFLRGDQTWATPAGGGGGGSALTRSGYWMTPPLHSGPATTAWAAADRAYYTPFRFPGAVGITALGLNVTGAADAGFVLRLAIMRDNGGTPGDVIEQGTVDPTTTGAKTLTLSATASLSAGEAFWCAAAVQGTGAPGSCWGGSSPLNSTNDNGASYSGGYRGSYYSSESGAIPNSPTTIIDNANRTPFIVVRIA